MAKRHLRPSPPVASRAPGGCRKLDGEQAAAEPPNLWPGQRAEPGGDLGGWGRWWVVCWVWVLEDFGG